MQAASHCCLLDSGQKGESEALAKVGPSQGCILVQVSILAEQCMNIFKKLLSPSSVHRQPIQAAAQRLASNQEGLFWKVPDTSYYERSAEVPCPTANPGHLPTREAELNPGHKFNPFCVWGLCLIRVSWWRKAGLGLSKEGDGLGAPECLLLFSGWAALEPSNSVARCQLTASRAQAVRQPGKEPETSQGGLFLLLWAWMRQLLLRSRLRKKLCRSKLDPAGAWLRLAGGGPVKKTGRVALSCQAEQTEQAFCGAATLSRQSADGPEQQAADVVQGSNLACVWVSAVCSFIENRPVLSAPDPPIHLIPRTWHFPTLTLRTGLKAQEMPCPKGSVKVVLV